MEEKLFEQIEHMSEKLIHMSDYIHDHPECDGKEYQAQARLTEALEASGFLVERGIGGLETAFRAEYRVGTGGPVIGLLCEYDALEGLGHGCGHHMQGPSCLGAAFAVKECLKDIPYTLVVYGTPAEETFGGKANLMQAGYLKELDVALMMHGAPETCTDVRCLALSTFEVTFHGIKAHAALAPEKGRSALDAMLLAFHGIELLREHVRDDVRMHYTFTELPGPENVVPARAVGHFTLRSYSREYLDEVIARFREIIQGAAVMGGVSVDVKALSSLDNKIPVFSLNDLLMKHAALAGTPELASPREKTGSTDFGNVTHQLPGACIRVQFVPKGTVSHSQAYVDAGKSRQAHACVIYGAKILAGTVCDLITEPALLAQVKKEFRKNKEVYR